VWRISWHKTTHIIIRTNIHRYGHSDQAPGRRRYVKARTVVWWQRTKDTHLDILQLPNHLACDSLRTFPDHVEGKFELVHKNLAIRAYGKMEINVHILGQIGWVPDWGGWSGIIPGKGSQSYWMGDWLNSRVGLETVSFSKPGLRACSEPLCWQVSHSIIPRVLHF
jgi:hypothetical protein